MPGPNEKTYSQLSEDYGYAVADANNLLSVQMIVMQQYEKLKLTGIDDESKNPEHINELLEAMKDVLELDQDDTPADIYEELKTLSECISKSVRKYKEGAAPGIQDSNELDRMRAVDALNKKAFYFADVFRSNNERKAPYELSNTLSENLSDKYQKMAEKESGADSKEASKDAYDFTKKTEDIVAKCQEHKKAFSKLGKLFGKDSEQYKNMMEALNEVSKLDRGARAIDVARSVKKLEVMTQAYIEKIQKEKGGNSLNGMNRAVEAQKMLEDIKNCGISSRLPGSFNVDTPLRDASKLHEYNRAGQSGFVIVEDYEVNEIKNGMKREKSGNGTNLNNLMREEGIGRQSDPSRNEQHMNAIRQRRNNAGNTMTEDTQLKGRKK